MQLELNLEQGRQAARRGAEAALKHARRTSPSWETRALGHLVRKGKQLRVFMAEDIRLSVPKGFPRPPDNRAWGCIMQAAARAGIIEHTGVSPQASKNCHGSHKTVWRWAGA